MRLTPLDIQNHQFTTRFRGFDPAEVDAFVRLIAEDYEVVARERDALSQQVRSLEGRVTELQAGETTLRDTLVTARALADDLKKTAVKEAEVVIAQAELRGERLLDAAQRRTAKLEEEIREMKLLRSRLAGAVRATIQTHLDLLEGLASDIPEADESALRRRVGYLTQVAAPEGGPDA